jgi:hypothetical protein
VMRLGRTGSGGTRFALQGSLSQFLYRPEVPFSVRRGAGLSLFAFW